MTKMLEGVVKEGTARVGVYNGALAGKTGTTSLPNDDKGARDMWFVGYTPNLVGAVWIGYDRTDRSISCKEKVHLRQNCLRKF